MEDLTKFNELEAIINEKEIAVFLFGLEDCGPCISLKNKLKNTRFNNQVYTYYISLTKNPEMASSMEILTAPTILVFIDGKLAIKKAGVFSFDEIIEKINYYSNLL